VGKRLTFTYDNNGIRTQVLDSAGGQTRFTYTWLNRLTNRSYTESGSIQTQIASPTTPPGRLIELDRFGPGFPAAGIATPAYTYDADAG